MKEQAIDPARMPRLVVNRVDGAEDLPLVERVAVNAVIDEIINDDHRDDLQRDAPQRDVACVQEEV